MARGRPKGLLISSCGQATGGEGARRDGRRARSEFWAKNVVVPVLCRGGAVQSRTVRWRAYHVTVVDN
jgi:hypothetical protein